MTRSFKNWVFTFNNYSDEDVESLGECVDSDKSIDYIGYSKEIGESGTPHLQGYLVCGRKTTLGALKKLTSDRIHFAPMKGTFAQNKEYCTKQSALVEIGKSPVDYRQGKRNDLLKVAEALRSGQDLVDVVRENTEHAIKYFGNMKKIMDLFADSAPRQPYSCPKVTVLYGPTGTGKTRYAYELFEGKKFYQKEACMGSWFDGYNRERYVLFDDFRGAHMQFSHLIKVLDGYDTRVQVKCGSCRYRVDEVIITSDQHPDNWYQLPDRTLAQLQRRISEVILVDENWEPPKERGRGESKTLVLPSPTCGTKDPPSLKRKRAPVTVVSEEEGDPPQDQTDSPSFQFPPFEDL